MKDSPLDGRYVKVIQSPKIASFWGVIIGCSVDDEMYYVEVANAGAGDDDSVLAAIPADEIQVYLWD